MSVGLTFRRTREQLGLTQVQLAKKLKINQVTISGYETNKTNPPPKIIKKLMTMALKEGIKVEWDDLREYKES